MLENWNLPLEKLVVSPLTIITAFSNQDVLRLSYFGHCLDLTISKGLQLPRVEMAIKKCRALVKTFSRSWKHN